MCRHILQKICNKAAALCAAVMFLNSCMSDPKSDIRIHGHRGCRGYLPENTIPSFVYAWKKGTPVLELDIVISADSQLIVSHDPFIHHEICTFPDGRPISADQEKSLNIFQMRAAEVRQFRCGSMPHPRFPEQRQLATFKPLLSDVVHIIDSLAQQRGVLPPDWNIEVKSMPEWDGVFHPAPHDYALLFLQRLSEINFRSEVYIQSFDSRVLNGLHKLAPRLKLVYLSEDQDKDIRAKLSELNFKPYGYSPNYALVDQSLVNYCTDHGLRLFVWTVNEEEEWDRLRKLGVKEIITDYPVKEKPAHDEPALNF
jgi:glycerophosphoryl diester phosphodiesterase